MIDIGICRLHSTVTAPESLQHRLSSSFIHLQEKRQARNEKLALIGNIR